MDKTLSKSNTHNVLNRIEICIRLIYSIVKYIIPKISQIFIFSEEIFLGLFLLRVFSLESKL